MTKGQRRKFYNRLREVKDFFQWKLTRDGKLRAILHTNYYCPLTAIARAETGKRFPSDNADSVQSPTLNSFSIYGKWAVMSAADVSKREYLSDEEATLRRTMLKIVGLS